MLAHTAIRESEVAVNHILGVEDAMNYDCIPGVVYTNPEVAGVGKTEEELKALGTGYHIQKLPMAYSGRFVAENELGNGLCKLVLDDATVSSAAICWAIRHRKLLWRRALPFSMDIRWRSSRRAYSRIPRWERSFTKHFLRDVLYR